MSIEHVGTHGEGVHDASRAGMAVASAVPRELSIGGVVAQRLAARWSIYVSFFRRHLRRPEDAEDAAQDFCVKALRAAATLNDAGRIDAWLARILRNTLVDQYRRGAARRRAEVAYWHEMQATVADADSAEDVTPRYCVRRLLERLEPSHAAILRRFYLDEQPRESIAAELGLTANNVGVRLHRARRALRNALHGMALHFGHDTLPACECGSAGGGDRPRHKARPGGSVTPAEHKPWAAQLAEQRGLIAT
jgi:RNA polymerase sigma factor (sigma-70 family)